MVRPYLGADCRAIAGERSRWHSQSRRQPRRRRLAVALSLVVPPGSETPIHDHLAWGLVGLYRATQDEDVYVQRDGSLQFIEQRSLAAGDFYVLIPPRDDIHLDERHRLRLAARLRSRLG